MKGKTTLSEPSIGSAHRIKLGDISNLQVQAKQPNQSSKQQQQHQHMFLSSKEYLEKLEKENMTLMKVLADRNKLVELSGIELKKMRSNLKNVQEQNLQLAQANTQILVELNANKDRLKALQHELGCKNGLLKARKMQLEEQTNRRIYLATENEVGTTDHGEAGESCQTDNGAIKNTKRRRQSKTTSSNNSDVKPLPANENVNKKRRVSGRKSSSVFEEPDITGIYNEANQTKENGDKSRHCKRRQSGRLKSEEPEQTENLQMDDAKETTKNERLSTKRRHTRSKSEALEPTENLHGIHDVKHTVDNRRPSGRRQSARFKSQEPEPTEKLHELDDIKKRPSSIGADVEQGHEEEKKSSIGADETQYMKRTSVGRPLRQAAEKVQSYKEISIKTKMRRN